MCCVLEVFEGGTRNRRGAVSRCAVSWRCLEEAPVTGEGQYHGVLCPGGVWRRYQQEEDAAHRNIFMVIQTSNISHIWCESHLGVISLSASCFSHILGLVLSEKLYRLREL